jgi:outer membrane protein assembly factor BamD (BamD/ComL family)
VFTGILTITFLLLIGCSAKFVGYEQQLLSDADSLFRVGHFEFAKIRYQKIRELKPKSTAARTAQYYLGYINVYYENSLGNWEAALREFKLFASLYPDDERIDEVNSWIKLLLAMQLFKKNYQSSMKETKTLENELSAKEAASFENPPVNVDALNESLRNCSLARDSLQKKTKDLENLILELERRWQEVYGNQ